jgi:L-rhamnose-H+ transport protein
MNIAFGVVLAILAGVINGLFALPMKLARHWSWENTWLPFSVLGLILFPRLVIWNGVPRLQQAYAEVGWSTVAIPILWGVVIYTGSMLFGRSMVYIGTALAFALLVGSMSIVGVLMPLVLYSPAVFGTSGGRWILLGIAILFMALVACAKAGALKAVRVSLGADKTRSRSSAILGMTFAIVGGALSGLLSLGLNTGWAHAISQAAVRTGGATDATATNAVLLLVLLGGSIPNCLYCAYLLSRNGTWHCYRKSWSYWLIILLMAGMYSGSTAIWGVSTSVTMLGKMGPSIGWALYIGAIAVSSNVGGFLTGEWNNAGRTATRIMVAGLALIVVAMGFVGYGNSLVNLGNARR